MFCFRLSCQTSPSTSFYFTWNWYLSAGRLGLAVFWVWWWSPTPGATNTSATTSVRPTARWGPTAKLSSSEVTTEDTADYSVCKTHHNKWRTISVWRNIAFAYISIQFLLTMETMKLQIAKNLLKCKRNKKRIQRFYSFEI